MEHVQYTDRQDCAPQDTMVESPETDEQLKSADMREDESPEPMSQTAEEVLTEDEDVSDIVISK